MNRIGCNDIEFLFRREKKVPRVVVDDLHAGVFQYVVVLRREIFSDDLWYERLDFTNDDSFNRRVRDEASRGDTRAKADNQYGTRPLVQQRGKMPEHSLKTHVVRFGRCFDLSADMKVAKSSRGVGDSDGRVDALA